MSSFLGALIFILESSYPSNKSAGISCKNLDGGLCVVEPKVVRCLLFVKNRFSFALVTPT